MRAFGTIFLPPGLIDGPTEPFVENKLDVATIRRLYEQLSRGEEFNEFDRKSENKLRRFLRGDFKNGIGFDNIDEAEADIDQAEADEEPADDPAAEVVQEPQG